MVQFCCLPHFKSGLPGIQSFDPYIDPHLRPAVEFVASFEWYSLSPKSALCTKTEQETYNIPSASPFPPETNTEPAELSHHEIVAHHALLHILILAWSEPGGPLGGGFRLVAAISGEHDLGFKLINLTPVVTSHTYIYIYIYTYIYRDYIYIHIYIYIYIYTYRDIYEYEPRT